MIQAILRETSDIPPVKIAQAGIQPLRADTLPAFANAVMKDYKPDKEETPFREAITKATAVMQKLAKPQPGQPAGGSFQEEFATKNAEQLKQQVQPVQRSLAVIKLELDEALADLEKLADERDNEKSKRWQATYDYVTARLLMRVAYVFEYSYVISDIRTDGLPELSPANIGWRLASSDKMAAKGDDGKEAKKRMAKAKSLLERLTKEHKGTPYEILAKREMSTSIGLQWQPLNGAGAVRK
ncbi:hypothetical protein AYO40_06720 [Planctomycetaceae bacterium SCGC AG-212-D15]|nr:hypothetical protein AYO40_06720 [Planctomycetaceae bacterium SCGC AG-212-D15]